jgi:hypothetical protein
MEIGGERGESASEGRMRNFCFSFGNSEIYFPIVLYIHTRYYILLYTRDDAGFI